MLCAKRGGGPNEVKWQELFLHDFKYYLRVLLIKNSYKTKDTEYWQGGREIGMLAHHS